MKRVLVLVTILLQVACSSLPHALQAALVEQPADNSVYVISHGWHTGLVVPAKAIQSRIKQLETRFDGVPYIEFGWGDQAFYQANTITSGLILRAILWPTESVIHTVAVPADVQKYFNHSQVRILCLNETQLQALIEFIASSFFKNERGDVLALNNGIYGDSQFYRAVGDYYLMNTCNKWTAKGIKSAGFDILPAFKLTASSIMDYLDGRQGVAGTTSGENYPLCAP